MKEILYIAINYKNGTTEAVSLLRNENISIEDEVITNSKVEYKKWLEEQKALDYELKFITLPKVISIAKTLDLELDEEQKEILKSIEHLIVKYFELDAELNKRRVKYDRSGKSMTIRYGGKANMAKDLISKFPPIFKIFVEPFGGAAHVLFKKSLSEVEVYNDIDPALCNLFSVVKDKEMCLELIDLLMLTLHSASDFKWIKFCLDNKIGVEDKVEYARKTHVNTLQSRDGLGKCYTRSLLGIRNGMAQNVSAYRGHEADLPNCHDRLQNVTIENESYEKVVEKYDSSETFFFIDSPYTHGSRVSKDAYEFEMTDDMHIEMCDTLSNVQGYVMICGYDNNIYDEHLRGFKKIKLGTYTARSSSKKKKGTREEMLWLNYDEDTGRKYKNN